jgi:hypothetical protein
VPPGAALEVAGRLAVPVDFSVIFPREAVLHRLAADLADDDQAPYGVIMIEHVGGAGGQWAAVFSSAHAEPRSQGRRRRTPDHLDRYEDLCEEIGV